MRMTTQVTNTRRLQHPASSAASLANKLPPVSFTKTSRYWLFSTLDHSTKATRLLSLKPTTKPFTTFQKTSYAIFTNSWSVFQLSWKMPQKPMASQLYNRTGMQRVRKFFICMFTLSRGTRDKSCLTSVTYPTRAGRSWKRKQRLFESVCRPRQYDLKTCRPIWRSLVNSVNILPDCCLSISGQGGANYRCVFNSPTKLIGKEQLQPRL